MVPLTQFIVSLTLYGSKLLIMQIMVPQTLLMVLLKQFWV